MRWLGENNQGITIDLHVIPNAKKSEIVGIHNDKLKIKISSPPVDGNANKEIIKFFSKKLKISKSNIDIVSGEKSRDKSLLIRNIKIDDIKNCIGGY